MKKVFLAATIVLVSAFVIFNLTSTKKIDTNNLIGHWNSDKESSNLIFWKNEEGKIQMKEISFSTEEPIDVLDFKIYDNYFLVKTIFKPNNWVANSKYTFVNDTVLNCVVNHSKGTTRLIYTKTK
jgi:hypothetical protein